MVAVGVGTPNGLSNLKWVVVELTEWGVLLWVLDLPARRENCENPRVETKYSCQPARAWFALRQSN